MRKLLLTFILGLLLPTLACAAPEPPPSNGPKATVVHETNLYVQPSPGATRIAVVQPGREMVVIEKNGPWDEVFANTDAPTSTQDQPEFGSAASAHPVSGWMPAKGVLTPMTNNGALILFGVAATEEFQASQPHPPPGAAQAARFLYERVVDFFPQSPLAPEAAWRTADINWQLMKADIFSLPSAHEMLPYMREQIDETQMKKLQKMYPNSRWADLAAWDLLDNKVCGSWQGSTKCPEMEARLYERYAAEHPRSPKAPDALYQATYREGVLHDMYMATGDTKKAGQASKAAIELANAIENTYPQSDYAARAAALVYKLEASIPIFGLNQE